MAFKCDQCDPSVTFEELMEWKQHLEDIAHESINSSICGKCHTERVYAKTTQKVGIREKGPQVFCDDCMKEIIRGQK